MKAQKVTYCYGSRVYTLVYMDKLLGSSHSQLNLLNKLSLWGKPSNWRKDGSRICVDRMPMTHCFLMFKVGQP
ncbi:hypothetical protein AMTR_s00014p00258150, partial [Amborella trichopoda]